MCVGGKANDEDVCAALCDTRAAATSLYPLSVLLHAQCVRHSMPRANGDADAPCLPLSLPQRTRACLQPHSTHFGHVQHQLQVSRLSAGAVGIHQAGQLGAQAGVQLVFTVKGTVGGGGWRAVGRRRCCGVGGKGVAAAPLWMVWR